MSILCFLCCCCFYKKRYCRENECQVCTRGNRVELLSCKIHRDVQCRTILFSARWTQTVIMERSSQHLPVIRITWEHILWTVQKGRLGCLPNTMNHLVINIMSLYGVSAVFPLAKWGEYTQSRLRPSKEMVLSETQTRLAEMPFLTFQKTPRISHLEKSGPSGATGPQ